MIRQFRALQSGLLKVTAASGVGPGLRPAQRLFPPLLPPHAVSGEGPLPDVLPMTEGTEMGIWKQAQAAEATVDPGLP